MPINEPALAAEFVTHEGVTTGPRLAALGISRRQVDRMVRERRLRRVGNGVLVATQWPATLEHRMAVACAVTRGVVMFPTAGAVWKLRRSGTSADVHVWVADSRRVKPPEGVRVHLTRHLPERDIVRRADGIAITSPPRTVFDAAAFFSGDDLESLIEHGIDLGYFVEPRLTDLSRRLGRSGRQGSGRFAAILASRPASQRPVRSEHELRLERAMRRRGFPPLVREPKLVLPDGEVIHPDLGLPGDDFFVEVDHLTWHGRRNTSANDRRRDLKARAGGHHVERVTDLSLDTDLEGTVDLLWVQWQRLRNE